jgi:nesprin-1
MKATYELETLEVSWGNIIQEVKKLKQDQENINDKVGSFQKEAELLLTWLKEMELRLKDLPMRSDVESKTIQYNTLLDMQNMMKNKEEEFDDLNEKANNLDLNSDIISKVSKLAHRFENLKVSLKDTVYKYDSFVKEHKNFNDQFSSFLGWILAIRDDLKQFSEIVGDLKVLQERRNNIEDLEEMRINESIKMDSIIELGEKLYSHTSVDGKEVIREQLQNLRHNWDVLTEEIQNSGAKIDTCIQQFSDFTSSQEQLTKWLKDIEKHMQQHTELKPSLQEKKAQLQNHRVVHQEVTSHNSLVETVCTKAQQLVDQTKDKSLNVYIDSIRMLFKNIGIKSGDLMEKLQVCVNDHEKFQSLTTNFSDFLSNQSDILTQCGDISGEKADLVRKQEILADLRSSKAEGIAKLQLLEETGAKVSKSTSKKGCDKIKRELNEIKESWSTHLQILDGVELNLEKAIALWTQFNMDIEKHQNWFKAKESIFRNQTLYGSLEEKKQQQEEYKQERLNVINYEKTIDDFVNNSHTLFHNSRVDRLKPIITQISNRYQLLHVLSKDVESKWQGIVEDHEQYAGKRTEITKWLADLGDAVGTISEESNISKKMEDLHVISAEHENGNLKVSLFSSLGERLFPDTDGTGREVIRQDIRNLRDQWEGIIQKVKDMQKRQDVQLQHWSAYQDGIAQMNAWLDSLENSSSLDQVNWLSVQETRSRLMKLKSVVQDISSHKRHVEAINEKAAAVISSNQSCVAEEIQESINDINDRFKNISAKMDETISIMEGAIEYMQHFQDLQKSHQDWQKQMWDKLSVYTDYTGSKNTLEARLEKVTDMEKHVKEGDNVLENINQHICKLNNNSVLFKVKEILERDLEHLR